MAVTQAIPITRHPYADGSYKKMLIDGHWVDAASGKKFETHNPATGELLATVAEGDAEDINRAVAAARRAFEGPWSKVKPFERQSLLLKLADLVEKNFEELSQLDTLDMGAPISRTRGQQAARARHAALLRGASDVAAWGNHRELAPRRDFFLHAEGAGRRRRCDHPLERPARRQHLEDRSRNCHRLHRDIEACRGGAADLAAARGALHGSRHSPRRRQRRARLWGRRRALRLPRIPASTRSPLPARISPDSRSSGHPLATSSGCRSSLAANRPISCSPTPTSIQRYRARRWRCSLIRARSAAPVRDCSSNARSMTSSLAASPNTARSCRSVTALTRTPRSGRWCPRSSWIGVSGYLSIGQKEGAKALAGGAPLTEGALAKGYFVPPTVFANVQDNMRIAQEEIFGPGHLGDLL